MKVYITKYALTAGIQIKNAEKSSTSDGMVGVKHGGYTAYFHGEGRDWHRTAESALKRAEEMRRKKIASLNKSLAKIEAMKFTVPE